VNQAIMACT